MLWKVNGGGKWVPFIYANLLVLKNIWNKTKTIMHLLTV